MSTLPPPEPQQRSCLERAFRFLVRLIVVIIFGIAIGIGIYFGVTVLYGEYVSLKQDYEDQGYRLAALETAQADAAQTNIDRLSDYQTRLETLEIQGDTQKEAISDLDSQLETAMEYLSLQATAVGGFEATQTGMQDTILALQTEINILQTNVETIQTGITDFQEDITALESSHEELADTIAENQSTAETMNEIALTSEARMLALQHQMVLIQAMELCTRARLNLVQGNTILAQSDIEAARGLLTAASADMPSYQAKYIDGIITVLDETLEFLPNAPVAAADRLESAWQMLLAGLPDEAKIDTGEEKETSEPQKEVENTPTPTPPLNIITSTPYP